MVILNSFLHVYQRVKSMNDLRFHMVFSHFGVALSPKKPGQVGGCAHFIHPGHGWGARGVGFHGGLMGFGCF